LVELEMVEYQIQIQEPLKELIQVAEAVEQEDLDLELVDQVDQVLLL
jgi:hypothetical protein